MRLFPYGEIDGIISAGKEVTKWHCSERKKPKKRSRNAKS